VGRLIAGANHRHPGLALADQAILKRQAGGIARSHNPFDSLMGEVVLEQVPGDFMGELKTLNQSQLQFAELPRLGQPHATLQHQQGTQEIVEALSPADVNVGHA
jgi:hypothetical protein